MENIKTEILFMKKLRQARLQVFQAQSLKELKNLMKNSLLQICQVNSISLSKEKGSFLRKKSTCFSVSLSSMTPYFISFRKNSTYSADEKKFLRKVVHSIDLALKRMETYSQLQLLKNQWKSTFTAIKNPICLTDQKFHILSSNAVFLEQVQQTKSQVFRKNCFSVFFGFRLTPVEFQNLKKSKILKTTGNSSIFEIYTQSFLREKKGSAVRLVMFTDMSRKIEMEKKISNLKESAELGIITGSIAHDLNNPLAGIQTLLEISNDPQMDEMLSAVRRCQSIVKKLLNVHSPQELLNISQIPKDKSLELSSSQ